MGWVLSWMRRGRVKHTKTVVTKNIYFICLIFLSSCSTAQEKDVFSIKGISFEAPKIEISTNTLKPITDIGANWISVMPYGYTRNGSPDIHFNSSWQWVGEREEGILKTLKSAKANKLKVMMKPHLWIHSQFTGDVKFENEEDWKRWEVTYTNYILFYAAISEKNNVELFCLGTELKEFVKARPQFWFKLINKVKDIYNGKLIYAANWDNYENIPFWKELDYIGIDAYFPVNDFKTPLKKDLLLGWNKWWKNLETINKENNKKIVFTEIGYRSIDYCAKEPWLSYDDLGEENQQGQYSSLEAFFETAKSKEYFEGAFLWKWHCMEHLPQKGNKLYTFQNKTAEELVREKYK